MNKYFKSFFSIPFALFLMFLFAVAIGLATFIENDYGTITARALIFNSWWLELIMVLLCATFMYNIISYKLYVTKKLPVLFLHLSFILIILGAGITRYIGDEGVMRIREGSFNNQFISSNTFLDFKIHNNQIEYIGEKDLLLSSLSRNFFSIPIDFQDVSIVLEYIDFISDPIDIIIEDDSNGHDILEFIIPSDKGGMQSRFLQYNEMKSINSLDMSFGVNLNSDFNIFLEDSIFYFISIYDVQYMKMSNQNSGVFEKGVKHKLSYKTLYTINSKNMVFKSFNKNAIVTQNSFSLKNDNSKLDLLKIKISVANRDTIVNLYGASGIISPRTYLDFNGLFFSLAYGSKNFSLPFAIFLKDFELERYPGSDSPSSFASEIEVIDGEERFDYRIFMNNVLNYKGFRFFQSSYDKDEKGTILSVNRDWWGTLVTYGGYLSLLLSIISVILSRFSRFNVLSKKLN